MVSEATAVFDVRRVDEEADMEGLKVGDRVVRSGFKWKSEPDRFGEVVEVYNGVSTATTQGVSMVAVRWDDTGQVERGYFNGVSMLRRYVAVPTVVIPDAEKPNPTE